MRKTKIMCTLGPACDNDEMLKYMIEHGLDCARLNFSHGTHEEQKVRMDRVKRIREELGIPLPILLDTKGPEIRIRDFKNGKILLKEGDTFTFNSTSKYTDLMASESNRLNKYYDGNSSNDALDFSVEVVSLTKEGATLNITINH